MSGTDGPARPPQTTAAGWTLVVGGAFVVLSSFESVASLRSLESREQVEELLAEPPGSGLGLGVEGVLQLMHVATLVTGACAAAVAVLGWQVLRRDRRARTVVSVLAVPLFVAGTFVGGLVTAVVAAAAALLWLQPTRAWFDGTEPPPRRGLEPPRRRPPHPLPPQEGAEDRPGGRERVDAPVGWPPPGGAQEQGGAQEPGGGPRPYDGFGSVRTAAQPDRPTGPAGASLAGGRPGAAYAGGPHPGPARRPGAVTVACTVTWVLTAVVGLLAAFALVAVLAAPDAVIDQVFAQQPDLAAQDVPRDQLVVGLRVVCVLVVVWCVAAAVLAGFAFGGAPWARAALLASALVTAVLSLLLSLDSVLMAVPMVAGAVVVACLLRPESRAFFARSRGSMTP